MTDESDYHVVQLHNGIKVIPKSDDPLESLREQFAGCEKTIEEIRAGALETALDDAGW